MSNDGELTAKQLQFVDALVAGANVITAANTCHLAPRTAYRWSKLPHVKQALKRERQAAFEEQLEALRKGVPVALATLLRAMKDEKRNPIGVQVSAASKWLDLALDIFKAEDLENRVLQLEEQIRQMEALR